MEREVRCCQDAAHWGCPDSSTVALPALVVAITQYQGRQPVWRINVLSQDGKWNAKFGLAFRGKGSRPADLPLLAAISRPRSPFPGGASGYHGIVPNSPV